LHDFSASRNNRAFRRPDHCLTARLDAIDRKILHALQADGRISNVDLAAKVHLSAPQCFRRVRSLESRGVLRGTHDIRLERIMN